MFLWARVEQERISLLTTPSPFQPTFNLKHAVPQELQATRLLPYTPSPLWCSLQGTSTSPWLFSPCLYHLPGPGRRLELREIQRRLRLAKQAKGSERLCAKRRGWALHVLPAGDAETDVHQPESYKSNQARETWSSRNNGRTQGGLTYRRANEAQIFFMDVTG